MGQPHEITSVDDPSLNPHVDRGAEMVEAEHGHSAEPKQCCPGWPSSASGAERTTLASGEVASVAAGRYPGCSAPAAG